MSIRETSPKPQLPRSHYFLTISYGRKMRTLAFRPWLVHGTLAFLPLLMIWSVTVSLYVGFHDQFLARIISQRTVMQIAYEDRLAALRAKLATVTSHDLVQQGGIQSQIAKLSARQILLEKRTALINTLAQLMERNADRTGSIAPRAALEAVPEFPARIPGFAPVDGAKPLPNATVKPRPEAMLLPGTGDDRPIGAQMAALSASQGEVNFQQLKALALLDGPAHRRAARLRHAISSTGLSPDTVTAPAQSADIGGPFIPLTTNPNGTPFEREAARLQTSLEEVAKLGHVVPFLPFGAPLPDHPAVTSNFGARVDPFLNRISLHPGIDFREAYGAPIYSTGAGKVVVAEWTGGYGNMVEIDHGNGLLTRYGHMSKINVRPGAFVKKGAQIGQIGSTGRSTGPHLHYEVRVKDQAVDPARFLRAGQMLAKSD